MEEMHQMLFLSDLKKIDFLASKSRLEDSVLEFNSIIYQSSLEILLSLRMPHK